MSFRSLSADCGAAKWEEKLYQAPWAPGVGVEFIFFINNGTVGARRLEHCQEEAGVDLWCKG